MDDLNAAVGKMKPDDMHGRYRKRQEKGDTLIDFALE